MYATGTMSSLYFEEASVRLEGILYNELAEKRANKSNLGTYKGEKAATARYSQKQKFNAAKIFIRLQLEYKSYGARQIRCYQNGYMGMFRKCSGNPKSENKSLYI